ncbi:MAG: hypothetical protein ACTHLW_15355 [Verrucomicrobiota bacterium]
MNRKPNLRAGCVVIILLLSVALVHANTFLNNGIVNAEFNARGLVSLQDLALGRTWHFTNDNCSVKIDGVTMNTSSLTPTVTVGTNDISFLFTSGNYLLKIVYELNADWRFVSRQIEVTPTVPGSFHVNAVTAMTAKITEAVASTYKPSNATGAAFLRFASSGPGDPGTGILLALQNDFLSWSYSSGTFTMSYSPDMDWNDTDGSFYGDRVCIGTYQMIGQKYPASQVGEWLWQSNEPTANGLDWSEIEAFQNCVRSFLLFHPTKATRLDIGWCENDFQIDTGTAAGRTEYKRIMDMCIDLGIDNLLYTPANDTVAPLNQNTDAWGWENVLWWNMGQQIRKGTWLCASGTLPPSVQEMVDYAQSKDLKLMAYAYPSLGFKQMAEWTAWCGGNTGGYVGADTGVRSFQDWFDQQLIDFHNNVGASGYSFDHWWIAYDSQSGQPPVSSRYAQWNGCRRILENLRKGAPDIIIDGRQQYQSFGVWTWLAGNYPHPTSTDEQPESFKAFPDLHTDRVSANRQRYTAWWYRMINLAPPEVTPGFITHQTQRYTSTGGAPRTDFRTRDWDLLGWRFSLFSTLGTAPFNLVMNLIPAKDISEFDAMPATDKQFIKDWFDWVDAHIEYMRVIRPILSQPMIGRVDGTAGILNDNGFVFLFNPNYRKLTATFKLDQTIGLKSGTTFVIKELEPQAGRMIGKTNTGVWSYGDTVSIPISGTTAMVLEIDPAPTNPLVTLYNVPGTATLNGTTIEITGATAEVGSSQDVAVSVPPGTSVTALTANGLNVPFTRTGDLIKATVLFDGIEFGKCQPIVTYNPSFTGGTVTGTFLVPARVFDQLAARRISWPVPFTEDDLLATWLGSDRLLLNIHIANPNSSMVVSAKIDGISFPVQTAWNGIYPSMGEQTFLGFYIDVSRLVRDVTHQIEVTVPGLAAGQFQGLFFDNVEPEYTQATTNAVTMPVTRTVSGRVTSTTGTGVAGAVVYFSDTNNAAAHPLITATADANGFYARTLPTPSTWYVAAGAAALNTSADQFVTVGSTDVTNINFSLVGNVSLSGTVAKRTDGSAIANATVYFSTVPNASLNPIFTATTDVAGGFTQALQNGTWYVSAAATGFFASADKPVTVNGSDVSGVSLTLAPATRNIPRSSDLLFACLTDSFPANGNTGSWPCYWPSGASLNPMATPSVALVNGIKWEKNLRTDVDGYDRGAYSSSIPVNGATIVVVAIPTRVAGYSDPWTSIVDIMYDRLVLGIHNGTGKVVVRRNGSLDSSSTVIPEGQITILSLVCQPDGQYKVFANGTEIMNSTSTSAMTAFVPNVVGGFANHINVGRNNPDSWPTFNGNIGDVFVYKVALSNSERQQLEADLYNKFVSLFITASAGSGGTIQPGGSTQVSYQGNQTFSVTPNPGYGLAQVIIDGVNQGALSSFTFTNVTANHTISASFVSLPPPTLSIEPNGTGGLEISWPDTYSGGLLTAPTLGAGAAWSPVGGVPEHAGGRFRVTVDPGSDAAFYGLGE